MTTKTRMDTAAVLSSAADRLLELTRQGELEWEPVGREFTPDAFAAEINDVRFLLLAEGRLSATAYGKRSSAMVGNGGELLAAIRRRYPQWWEVDEEGWKAAVLNALR